MNNWHDALGFFAIIVAIASAAIAYGKAVGRSDTHIELLRVEVKRVDDDHKETKRSVEAHHGNPDIHIEPKRDAKSQEELLRRLAHIEIRQEESNKQNTEILRELDIIKTTLKMSKSGL